MKEKKCIRCQGYYLTADLLCYLDYLFEKAFSGMTQVKTKLTESACSRPKLFFPFKMMYEYAYQPPFQLV